MTEKGSKIKFPLEDISRTTMLRGSRGGRLLNTYKTYKIYYSQQIYCGTQNK